MAGKLHRIIIVLKIEIKTQRVKVTVKVLHELDLLTYLCKLTIFLLSWLIEWFEPLNISKKIFTLE